MRGQAVQSVLYTGNFGTAVDADVRMSQAGRGLYVAGCLSLAMPLLVQLNVEHSYRRVCHADRKCTYAYHVQHVLWHAQCWTLKSKRAGKEATGCL